MKVKNLIYIQALQHKLQAVSYFFKDVYKPVTSNYNQPLQMNTEDKITNLFSPITEGTFIWKEWKCNPFTIYLLDQKTDQKTDVCRKIFSFLNKLPITIQKVDLLHRFDINSIDSS